MRSLPVGFHVENQLFVEENSFERKCVGGISRRPKFPRQQEVVDLLRTYAALPNQTQPATLSQSFSLRVTISLSSSGISAGEDAFRTHTLHVCHISLH